MSTGISSSDFVGQWSLSFADIDFINSKPAATRLGLAAHRPPVSRYPRQHWISDCCFVFMGSVPTPVLSG
jgi:hypothetical protein